MYIDEYVTKVQDTVNIWVCIYRKLEKNEIKAEENYLL